MEFFKKQTKINFMGLRKYTATLSLVLWVIAIALLAIRGLHFGLEFTGGLQVEVRCHEAVSPSAMRNILEEANLSGVRVQQYGSTQDLLIRIANTTLSTDQFKKILKDQHYDHIEIRRIESVGSEVGSQLVEKGTIAVVLSIIATMIYIALRFEYRLALSAAVGLCHDAFLILGVFSLLNVEFDLAALASILAVLGYSLNDTIVVFDRVRENFRKMRKISPLEIMNVSINQTLSRTIMTSFLTLLVVLALFFFGGESLFGFSLAFLVGIIVGTFSSIYVSGALALWLGLTKEDLMPKIKAEIDQLP